MIWFLHSARRSPAANFQDRALDRVAAAGRGCPHLAALPFNDRVLFHHEFDTAWRASYWHNYLPEPATSDEL